MARRIVHMSDLHFGRTDTRLVRPLVDAVLRVRPDLVVVSGDLTQRARRREFEEARRLIDSLPSPVLVVPGNHDIPLWHAAFRFLAPRRRWHVVLGLPWISTWYDDEVVVVGIDSPRSWRAKQGAVSAAQIRHVASELSRAAASACRVVVLHHPLALPRRMPVGRPHVLGAHRAMEALHELGVDMVLAGHLHVSGLHHVVDTEREGMLHVLAPSAISTRLRGEVNGFNVIHVDGLELTTTLHSWNDAAGTFDPAETTSHRAGRMHA